MSIQLNHRIIHCKDKTTSAKFLAEILGLPRRRVSAKRPSYPGSPCL
jgi:hypothetical protein